MTLITRLKYLRIKHNLSQAQMGRIIAGMDSRDFDNNLKKYIQVENGKQDLTIKEFLRICKHFNIPGSYLIDYDKEFGMLSQREKDYLVKIYRNMKIIAKAKDPQLIETVASGISKIAETTRSLNGRTAELAHLEEIEQDYHRIKKELQDLKKEMATRTKQKKGRGST